MQKTGLQVPKELKHKLPGLALEVAEPKLMWGMMVFFVGTMIAIAIRLNNLWMYLIPPVLGPIVHLAVRVYRPWDPWHSLAAKQEGKERYETDAAVQRLLSLLKSTEGRRVVIVVCSSVALIQGTIAVLLVVLHRGRPIDRTFMPAAVVVFAGMFYVFTGYPLVSCLLRWAFRAWDGIGEVS